MSKRVRRTVQRHVQRAQSHREMVRPDRLPRAELGDGRRLWADVPAHDPVRILSVRQKRSFSVRVAARQSATKARLRHKKTVNEPRRQRLRCTPDCLLRLSEGDIEEFAEVYGGRLKELLGDAEDAADELSSSAELSRLSPVSALIGTFTVVIERRLSLFTMCSGSS